MSGAKHFARGSAALVAIAALLVGHRARAQSTFFPRDGAATRPNDVATADSRASAASPTAAAPVDAAPPPPHDDHAGEATPPRSFRAELAGGYVASQLFDASVRGGRVELGLGADRESHAFMFRVSYDGGATDRGLGVSTWRIAASAELLLGARLRLGAGAGFVNTSFWRVTSSEHVDHWGLGAYASATMDVVRLDDHAVFIGARAGGDWLISTGTWNLGVGGGVRF